MPEIDSVFVRLDQLITASRLNELAVIAGTDRVEQIARMMTVLSRLRPGAYLLGTGPSTVGIISLTMDEVMLGRMATPAEKPSDTVVDCVVSDALWFAPHEVSRVHAKVVRRMPHSDFEYRLLDLGSTCGTYVNDERVPPEGEGCRLSHGDVISLGPSRVSTYLFYIARAK